MTQPIVVAALYKFVTLEDYVELREPLLACMEANGVKGTLLLAEEGINGTVSATREGIDGLLAWLRNDPRLVDVDHKESYCDEQPFYRTKVKLKKEIVTLGVPGVDPNKAVGTYIEPQDWNAIISDPEVLLIDTRNDYEVAIGTFEGAIDPKTTTFREFPDYIKANFDPSRHKKVAMFCTGGIRCEKASSYMLGEGFEEVYHLKGGILKYLEEVPQDQSKWQGDCFVFDNRVTVRHDLTEGDYDQCHACRHPVSAQDRASEHYSPGISCPHCWDTLSEKTRRSAIDRQKQIELAKARNQPHPIGYNYRKAEVGCMTARLLYVMDPMCSWCWGFAPVAAALIAQARQAGVETRLVLGGLRTGSSALDASTRRYILEHWQAVNEATGQTFQLEGAMPDGFVYDTEPACRALVTARSLDPEAVWPLLALIQQAFYQRAEDVTLAPKLVELAEQAGFDRARFAAAFASAEQRSATAADISWVQDLGIAGFPTLLAERNGQLALLTNGYQPLDALEPLLGRWLERAAYA